MEAVEADWAEQLDGMSPQSIRRALESLPHDYPPTCTAFRALGSIREESEAFVALPLPKPDPEAAKRVRDAVRAALKVTH
jgi:hypothetical protein